MGKAIGIDFGDRYVITAVVGADGPRVLDSKECQPKIPCVVSLKRQKGKAGGNSTKLLVGDGADDYREAAPKDTIVCVRRLMGRGVADTEVQQIKQWAMYNIVEPSDGTKESVCVIMGDKEYSPVDISAMILKKVKEDAEYRLGEEVTHAVITVPAYFSRIQRDATCQSGLQSGLTTIKILDESTATAIAFGMDSQEGAESKYILVYELDDGIFDISVLLWIGNVFATLALQGDMWLGGDDFDHKIMDHVIEHVKKEYDLDARKNSRFMLELTKQTENAKEALLSMSSTDIIIAGILQNEEGYLIDVDVELTREQFEKMIKPLVDKSVRLTEKALENAALSCEQIDHVLMAGNATNVPLVQEAMEQMFGKEKVLRNIHPEYCVALGAAIVASLISEQLRCECGHVNQPKDVVYKKCDEPSLIIGSPFHYGIQSDGDKFNIFIHKGDFYPTQNPQTQIFYTKRLNQRLVRIPIYGGENMEKASANDRHGDIFAILPSNYEQGTAIRIKLWLDDDGIFKLEAHLEDGTDLHQWILEGESIAQRVIEEVQKIEGILHNEFQFVSTMEIQQLEKAKDKAVDKLEQGDFHGALKQAKFCCIWLKTLEKKVEAERQNIGNRCRQERKNPGQSIDGAFCLLTTKKELIKLKKR